MIKFECGISQLRCFRPLQIQAGAGNDFPKLSREVSSYLPHMVYEAVQENLFLLFKSCEGTRSKAARSSFEHIQSVTAVLLRQGPLYAP